MLRLIGKEENINYSILTLIYGSRRGMTAAQLAEELDMSVKTIRVYLDEITNYLGKWSPDIQIKYENKSYKIACRPEFNIEIVYSAMKKEASFFDLYHYHFSGGFHGVRDFSTEHYCSSSRVYSRLKKMRELLSPYNIRLGNSLDNYGLIGDEQMIRFHTFHYYWEIYKGIEWPFDADLEAECEKYVEELAHYMSLEFSIVEQKKLVLWIGIIKTRIKLEEFVELDKRVLGLIMKSNFWKKTFIFIHYFFEQKRLNSHNESYFFLLIMMFTCKRFVTFVDMEALGTAQLIEFCSEVEAEIFASGLSTEEIDQYNILLLEGSYYHQYLTVDLLVEAETPSPQLEAIKEKFKETLAKYDTCAEENSALISYYGRLFFDVVDWRKVFLPVKVQFLLSNGFMDEMPIRRQLLSAFPNLIFCSPDIKDCDVVITDLVSRNDNQGNFVYFKGRSQLEWDTLNSVLLTHSLFKDKQQKILKSN